MFYLIFSYGTLPTKAVFRTTRIQATCRTTQLVLSDWGRQAADSSFFNAYTVSLCANLGQCCSSLQDNNFPDDFDAGDYGMLSTRQLTVTLFCPYQKMQA